MKNITVSLDDETYHAALVAAARQKTNLTALVRRYLQAFASSDAPELIGAGHAQAEGNDREHLVRLFEDAQLVLGYQPGRDKSYER